MKIKINGELKELKSKICLSELIQQHLNNKDPKGVAVAMNGKIIPKQQWRSTTLNDVDDIEIVHAVQGG
jgi:sulfur carrier protein